MKKWFVFSSTNEKEEDGAAEFRECIRVLADKVGALSRHRAELADKCSKFDAANKQVSKELEEKKELVNTLYKKHQHEKQVNDLASCILVIYMVPFLKCYLFLEKIHKFPSKLLDQTYFSSLILWVIL